MSTDNDIEKWERERGFVQALPTHEPKADTEKAVEKPPVSSLIPDTAYYPGFGKHGAKRPLDDKLIPYAAACIEIVRLLNDKAAFLYNQIVEVCKEPECDLLFATVMVHHVNNPRGSLKLLQTAQTRGLEKSVEDEVRRRMGGQEPPPRLWKAMEDFVLQGFNCEVDIYNGCPKVTLALDKNRALFVALTTNALTDAIGLNVPLHDAIKPGSALPLFGVTPKSRAERRRKTKLVASLHKQGFGAASKQMLLKGAALWYKARVNPGKLIDVASEEEIDPSKMSNMIEPYDEAVGYPR